MKKSEFKKLLKPIVKECIRESLLEGGLLSGVVSEVVRGLGSNLVLETKEEPKAKSNTATTKKAEGAMSVNERLAAHRKSIMNSVGADAYGGVDLFEGTTPAPAQASAGQAAGALSGTDPNDPGIDISGIMSVGGNRWKDLI